MSENPWPESPIDKEIPSASLEIYSFISKYLERKEDRHINRASSASMCYRRRWYQKEGFKGEPLTPRKMVNFLLGDLSEKTMQYFIKEGCVGDGKLYSEVDFGSEIGSFTIQGKKITVYDQENLTATIGNLTVTAHVDGIGKRNSDGKWELIECKSAADWGFEAFKDTGPDTYLKQAMVNLQTDKLKVLGAKSVRFFYLKKNTGHLWDRLYPYDEILAKQVEKEYEMANGKECPKRPYEPRIETFRSKPTGRTVLPFPCSGYCPYTKECWPEAKMEWKSSKPVYVMEIKQKESSDEVLF